MPPRSNDFQRFVLHVERQLAPDADVTESLMVTDADGVEREIDVAILGRVAGRVVRVAVECRDHKRRGDVGWVDEVIGKYNALPEWRVVIVAAAGFTKNARQKAARKGITTLTLEAATARDWAQPVRGLEGMTFTHVRYPIDGPCTVWCRDGYGPVVIPPPPASQARCFAQPDGPDVMLQWLVDGLLRSSADRARVDPALAGEANQRVALTIGFDH